MNTTDAKKAHEFYSNQAVRELRQLETNLTEMLETVQGAIRFRETGGESLTGYMDSLKGDILGVQRYYSNALENSSLADGLDVALDLIAGNSDS